MTNFIVLTDPEGQTILVNSYLVAYYKKHDSPRYEDVKTLMVSSGNVQILVQEGLNEIIAKLLDASGGTTEVWNPGKAAGVYPPDRTETPTGAKVSERTEPDESTVDNSDEDVIEEREDKCED